QLQTEQRKIEFQTIQ
ncbi:unnamed protein product, partial [Rotaria magnacalcarata]